VQIIRPNIPAAGVARKRQIVEAIPTPSVGDVPDDPGALRCGMKTRVYEFGRRSRTVTIQEENIPAVGAPALGESRRLVAVSTARRGEKITAGG
jgi:hypothetical protein